jgi:hypothetical protein
LSRGDRDAAAELMSRFNELYDEAKSRYSQPEAPPPQRETAPKPIDYQAIADKLRMQRKTIQARLVEFMADRPSAENEDVAEHVHKVKKISDKAIAANVQRTNDSLADIEPRLAFKPASGKVFRVIDGE